MFRAVIMGAPASGKGTISSRIVKTFNILHLSSGDLLRKNIMNKTELGVIAGKTISEGKLVSDDIMLKLMLSELNNLHSQHWVLDGFPRTRVQAEALTKEHKLQIAIALEVPVEEIINRAKSRWIHVPSGRIYNDSFQPPKVPGVDDVTGEALQQRPDDTPDAVRKRLETYSNTAQPLLDFYSELGILQRFSGRTSDEIWPQVRTALLHHLKPHQEINRS